MRPFFKFASAHQAYMESSSSLPLHGSRLSLQFSLQKNIQPAPVPEPAQETLDVVIWWEPPSTCFPILGFEQVFLFSQGWICELCAQDTVRWVWPHKASQSEVSKNQSSLETKQENILSQYKCKKSPLPGLAQLHNAIGEQFFLGPSLAAQSSPSHIPLPRSIPFTEQYTFKVFPLRPPRWF